MSNSQHNQSGFSEVILLIVVVGVVAAVGLFAFSRMQKTRSANTVVQTSTPAPKKQMYVTGVAFSAAVDAQGKALSPTTSFKATDGKINTVVSLKGLPKNNRVEYTRYLNDKFVDNGSLAVTKDKAQYVGFDFVPKPGKIHPVGTYKVKIYVNGVFQATGSYAVQ